MGLLLVAFPWFISSAWSILTMNMRSWPRVLAVWFATYMPYCLIYLLVAINCWLPHQLVGGYSLTLFCLTEIIETNMVVFPLLYGPWGACTWISLLFWILLPRHGSYYCSHMMVKAHIVAYFMIAMTLLPSPPWFKSLCFIIAYVVSLLIYMYSLSLLP